MHKPEDTPGITWIEESKRYQLRIFDQGKRVHASYYSISKYGSKTKAGHAVESAWVAQKARWLQGDDLSKDRLTVVELLDQYVKTKGHWSNPRQLKTQANHLRPLLGTTTVRAFDAGDVSEIKIKLGKGNPNAQPKVKPLAPKTVGHVMSCLRGALQRAVDAGIVKRNEALEVKLPRVPRRRERFSAAEIALLLDAAGDSWLFPAVLMLTDCALRPGECSALRWEDIDPMWMAVHVQRSRQDLKTTKTDAGQRVCGLTPRLRAALEAWKVVCPSQEWIFPGPDKPSTPITVQSFDKSFFRLLKKAEVRRRRPYDLRHTAITWMVTYALRGDAPLNLQDVARWAGHKDVRTTLAIYTDTVGKPGDMARVMETAWADQLATTVTTPIGGQRA